MKRCPHCNFIFPDSDELCDFDRTRLVTIAENEIDVKAVPGPVEMRRENRKALLMAAVVGISSGLILFVSYRASHRQSSVVSDVGRPQNVSSRPAVVTITPSIEPSPMPAATPVVPPVSVVAKSAPSPTQTAAHAKVSVGPVTTESKSADSGGKPVVIRLASGGKVEADEVWRTKEGVWYRRDGVVTLLKSNRVKAIVNQ